MPHDGMERGFGSIRNGWKNFTRPLSYFPVRKSPYHGMGKMELLLTGNAVIVDPEVQSLVKKVKGQGMCMHTDHFAVVNIYIYIYILFFLIVL